MIHFPTNLSAPNLLAYQAFVPYAVAPRFAKTKINEHRTGLFKMHPVGAATTERLK